MHFCVSFYLKNRFLLTLICWPIYHWLEVNREVYIYSLTIDQHPVIYWTTKHVLAILCFDSSTQETFKKRRKGKCFNSDVLIFPPLLINSIIPPLKSNNNVIFDATEKANLLNDFFTAQTVIKKPKY